MAAARIPPRPRRPVRSRPPPLVGSGRRSRPGLARTAPGRVFLSCSRCASTHNPATSIPCATSSGRWSPGSRAPAASAIPATTALCPPPRLARPDFSHLRHRPRTASRHKPCCSAIAWTLCPSASSKTVSARSRSRQSALFLMTSTRHSRSQSSGSIGATRAIALYLLLHSRFAHFDGQFPGLNFDPLVNCQRKSDQS